VNRVLSDLEHTADPIKGSKFRASVLVVDSFDAAREALAGVRAADPDATHHCWAFRLADGGVRCSDDGEPSGTAGRPILARLEGRDLVDVLVVVTRWYGGTKLGAGGLVRAYGRTAGDALDRAEIEEWVPMTQLVLTCSYAHAGAVDALVKEGEVVYAAEVTRTLTLASSEVDALVQALQDATAGGIRFEVRG
jgi:uncharacterized YigZ family protein